MPETRKVIARALIQRAKELIAEKYAALPIPNAVIDGELADLRAAARVLGIGMES